MHDIFNENKYQEAASKAYEFIKRMLDPAEWEVRPYYGEPYNEEYAYKLMWGGVEEIPDDAERIDPNYIKPDQYYYPGYSGEMKGTWQLPEGEDPRNYAVAIYRVTSESRVIEEFCPLLQEEEDDGTITRTWSAGRLREAWEYYPDTLENTTSKVVYWYWEDKEVSDDSTVAWEIEFVRKDWDVTVTDEIRQTYLNDPEGRTDYLGIATAATINLHDILAKETVHETLTGLIGKDDLPITTTEIPEVVGQVFRLPDPEERHKGTIEYGYSQFVDYKVELYSLVLGDAEYLNAEVPLWSDVIYDLPAVPPPMPELGEEITDITIFLGEVSNKQNVTFLSTIDTENAEVEVVGGTVYPATNTGYLSHKYAYATYKAEVSVPQDSFEYILRADTAEKDGIYMVGRPESNNTYQFLAAGDPQITNSQSIENWKTSLYKGFMTYTDAKFIAVMGDVVDAQVDMTLAEQQFTGFLSPPEMKTHPILTAMGNHDDNIGFEGHFFPPNESTYGVAGGMGDYWVRYEDTLFMVLNTNVKDEDIQQHVAFLNETMEQYRSLNGTPTWTIVMFHHSIFQPTNTAEEAQYVLLRNTLAPVFSQLGVDLVLMGHVHSYCRTYVMDCTSVPADEEVTESVIVPDSDGDEFTKTSSGQVLYITLNSASGSKYYPLSGDPWYSVIAEQELIPNISCVDVNDDRIQISTHRTSDMSLVDRFTLQKGV